MAPPVLLLGDRMVGPVPAAVARAQPRLRLYPGPSGRTIRPMAAQGSAAPVGEPGAAEEYLQVQTTTDSRVEAMELARAAVEARLAACAQVAGPVASTYWWNDELERAEEWFVF